MRFVIVAVFALFASSALAADKATCLEHEDQASCQDADHLDVQEEVNVEETNTAAFGPRGVKRTAPKVKVTPHALSQQECDNVISQLDNSNSFQQTRSGHRWFTDVKVESSLYGKLVSSVQQEQDHTLPISHMFESSQPHQDHFIGKEKCGQIVNEEVSIVYLTDTEDATFVYGDQRIPIQAGTRLTFHGGQSHHTEVHGGGVVKFLGPFLVNSGSMVGDDVPLCEEQCASTGKGGLCRCSKKDSCDVVSEGVCLSSCKDYPSDCGGKKDGGGKRARH